MVGQSAASATASGSHFIARQKLAMCPDRSQTTSRRAGARANSTASDPANGSA